MYTRIPLGDGVKMDPSTWYGVVKGGKGKNEVSKQRRGWAWSEAACTHAKLPLTPLYSSTFLPPPTSHPLYSLPWPQGPHPSAYFALTNTVATPLPTAPSPGRLSSNSTSSSQLPILVPSPLPPSKAPRFSRRTVRCCSPSTYVHRALS